MEKFEEIVEIVLKKFEKASEWIFEKTGVKVNVGMIVGSAFLILVFAIVILNLLKYIFSLL